MAGETVVELENEAKKGQNGSNHFKKHFNILTISDIGGATRYMSRDNVVGLAEYLDTLNESDMPDMLVIIGGLFPGIPKQGSTSSIHKIKVRSPGVDSIDDAAAIMKPHMLRLVEKLPKTTKIIYAFNGEDWENIKTLERKVADEYLFYVDSLEGRLDAVVEELLGVSGIINIAKKSAAKLEEQLKTDPKNPELLRERNNVRAKLKIREEEYNDLLGLLRPLKQLYAKALELTSAAKVKSILEGEIEKQKRVQADLDKLDKNNTDEYLKLSKKAKRISNNISRLTKRYKEALDSETKTKENKSLKQALTYTHNALPDKEATTIIESYVRAYYKEMIDYTFGFRKRINISSESIALDDAEENADNQYDENAYTNFSVYKRRLSKGYLNVIVMGSANRYALKSNDELLEKLYIRMRSGLVEYDVKSMPINVLITGHNMQSTFTLLPLTNQGPITAALASGPFWDVKRAAKLAEKGYRTDTTVAAQKGSIGSGAHLLRIEENSIRHSTITSDLLKVYAAMRYKKERDSVNAVISNMEVAKAAPKNGGAIGSKIELERSILRNKLPSELKEDDLARDFVDATFIKSTVSCNTKPQSSFNAIKLGVISDAHVGNYADIRLLGKIVAELMERKLDVLVFAGDNIEGNYNNYKNVPREQSSIDYHQKVEAELKRMGYNDEFIKAFMLELIRTDEKKVIHNIEEQSRELAEMTRELVYDVLARGGTVVIVSGNHYNKTTEGWQFDEATRLESEFKGYISGRAGDDTKTLLENLKIVPGGESGGGVISIYYTDTDFMRMRVEHEGGAKPSKSTKIAERSRDDGKTKLIIKGHIHISEEIDMGGRFIVTASTLQDSENNPYLNRINIPVSDMLKGAMYAELVLASDGVKAISTEPLIKLFFTDSFDLLRSEVDNRLKAAHLHSGAAKEMREAV
ncbi:MAG: hypothetical protein ACP5UH_02885 [Candidatus Micrarchaeia archaeon]